MITGIGVVVPAHNAQEHIAACVDALGAAVYRLPDDVAHAVCLVLDRCEDRTAERAAAALDRHPAVAAGVDGAGHPVVSATDLEVRTSARRLGRASGGLADLLGNLPDAELPELDVS
jgi:hypothetical protein